MYSKMLLALILILALCYCNEKRNTIPNNQGLKTSNSSLAISALEQKADNFYENNQYYQAIECFDKLIKIDSTKGEYYLKRGYANGMLLRRQAALQDYNIAITLKYRLPDAYFNAGLNCSAENDSLALYYFKRSLAITADRIKVLQEIDQCEKRLSLTVSK